MPFMSRIGALALLGAAAIAAAGPTREPDADVDGMIDQLHGDHVPFR